MLYTLLLLVFFIEIVRGFVRVIVYFSEWLQRGQSIDEESLEPAVRAMVESDDALEREMARASQKRGLARVFARWQATNDAVDEYLDNMNLSWYQVIIIFFVGCMAGLLLEEIWMLVTAGLTENRVGLVWGPFSVVWGLALALATVLLRQNRDKSDRYLFAFGTIMGGVYEYVCSAVTELLFGTVFWDYSKFKFNLGGRINLLYCFFWGIAAVLWMRYGYPLVLRLMKKVRSHIRPWMTAALAVFMAVNMLTSALALARYDARTSGEAPNGQLEVFLDAHFDNARMERIYPNAKKVIKAE